MITLAIFITSLTAVYVRQQYKWHSLLRFHSDCLRERATILRYTRIALLVIFIICILSLFVFNFMAASMIEVKTGDSLYLQSSFKRFVRVFFFSKNDESV
jgi:hypothetical protein